MIQRNGRIVSVKCSVTGKECFVNPGALDQRLKKFGSIELIEKNWISREGKECKEEKSDSGLPPRGPDGRFIPKNK